MPTVNMHEAKSQLSALVEAANAGEEVIIARAGKPVARLVPFEPADQPRKPGGWDSRGGGARGGKVGVVVEVVLAVVVMV